MTLADVAEYAGVSASTASRALNGRGELSPATRAAVLEAADILAFEPSHLARSLRTRRTHTVGFVVPDVSSPFYAAALKGAQGALEQAGYRVLLMDSTQAVDGEVAALRTLLAHRVDGVLVSTVGIDGERFDALVTRRGIPCVFFDSELDGAGDGAVLLDNAAGIELLVEHLARHGHTRIGLLAGSPRETSGRDRRDAFVAAMRSRGLEPEPGLVAGERWSLEEGRAATRAILAAGPRPTALVSSSVELALGALLACRELGVGIPDELALATFDDAYFAELLDPPLTAVAYDPADVGRRAAELLVAAIGDGEVPARDVTVPVDLVVRRSCGCGT
ncbi:MAG TPA: LacI family DNA-binding transcriptional regulator [Gaiellaceae bacterium]|nr:LacI family DNA-binding transcriptional regulator [Gaiellaceae bacterium]